MAPALLRTWAITEAGDPPQPLPAHHVVDDVEALCRGVIREITGANPLSADDVEQMLSELLTQVVVLTRKYDRARAGIVFRPWLYRELRWAGIDYLRGWFGRRGEKRVIDERVGESGLRDSGLDDGAHGADRLDGAASSGASDSPQDRASDLGWLYARGDRATLREERRMGFDEGAGAAPRDCRAGARAGSRARPEDPEQAPGGHWRDCGSCGWRNFRTVAPNGDREWHFPESCLSCGAPLEREFAHVA